MRAIRYDRYGGSDVLQLLDLPRAPMAPDEIRVALSHASVTPLDCKLRAGLLKAHFTVDFPKVPGRDGAGTVSEVGAAVTDFAVGDRVCVLARHGTQGSYASERVSRADDLVPIPGGLSDEAAASLVNAGLSAWVSVFETARIEPGTKVLVHAGAGAVGGLIVQLCRNLGAEVTATCRAANCDYVRSLGASRAVAYDTEDFGKLCDQDVVFDLVGGETHARSYPILKKGGHLVWLVAAPIVDRGAEYGVEVTRAMITDRREPVEAILTMAAKGEIAPQIAGVLPLAEAAEAHRRMEAGEVTRGRMLLATG
ncbi:NADP-dependent oxidoreductase [Aurantimonas sp. VKM B-3413]|uniref:NADP-dependent oxidoreductase n=1 Tax=Aurantimonas sp. VKM B-3413 TaxID=2779401 RepID=UPI001E2AE4C8|nr:NADP-dependent oxidoreductase [Aurantimonas sp. VKM B-3413]MCB8840323.1 NADP-dependent oxidoreductase [Aurantimonas sp. VKM B-3413]